MRPSGQATAIAHPNIAFIKYWGNRDSALRLPANGSISMNLEGLHTRTQVAFDPRLSDDRVSVNDRDPGDHARARVRAVLDPIRRLAGIDSAARVTSENDFPASAGIASSASAFAALAVAAAAAAGLDLSEADLSRLARRGSGSAARSVPAGYVEWQPGADDSESYARSIAPPEHWSLLDCIAVVSTVPKATGSQEGHRLADTSPLQPARVASAPDRLARCRGALLARDFEALAAVVELDSHLMHAVMMTSSPPLLYWLPESVAVMRAVNRWRAGGLPAAYTLDAGPNVHVLTPAEHGAEVSRRLAEIPGVEGVRIARPGGPARLMEPHEDGESTNAHL